MDTGSPCGWSVSARSFATRLGLLSCSAIYLCEADLRFNPPRDVRPLITTRLRSHSAEESPSRPENGNCEPQNLNAINFLLSPQICNKLLSFDRSAMRMPSSHRWAKHLAYLSRPTGRMATRLTIRIAEHLSVMMHSQRCDKWRRTLILNHSFVSSAAASKPGPFIKKEDF
jgi:hypothetical protein